MSNSLYQRNRQKLFSQVKDGLVLVSSAPEFIRNNDTYYHFRQDSYFLYLTGIELPQHLLLLDPKRKKSHLFIPDINDHHRVWVGRQLTTADAKKKYGFSSVHYLSNFSSVLKACTKGYRKLHLLDSSALKHAAIKSHKIPATLTKDTKTLKPILDACRRYKEPEELEFMQIANRISAVAHIKAMQQIRAGMNECEVMAVLENEFLKSGAFHSAYRSIVAGGVNASILHYIDNNATCRKGDLILIDAGCEWHGYASDVTRAFPISGKFSAKQAEIYQIVLDTQKVCIDAIKPGATMSSIHILACKTLLAGLMKIGLVQNGSIDELFAKQVHFVFFPHGIGHLLGLDVHDVGATRSKNKSMKNLRSDTILEPGMVVTVEPGLYFIEAFFDSAKTRKKFADHINWKKAEAYRSVGGIRIEDDIIVTKTGHRNLTTVPKEIRDIEELMLQ